MAKSAAHIKMSIITDTAKLAMWDDLVERAEEGDRIITELRAELADRDARLATIAAEITRIHAVISQ